MIQLLRFLFLPTMAFLIIAMLAVAEWSKITELKEAADKFHRNSEIRFFRDAGNKESEGVSFPAYEYEVDGETREFETHYRIELPPDGKVRMGLDPLPPETSSYIEPRRRMIFVPIDGPDTVETVYKGIRGHEIGRDYRNAALVSVAALIAGVAGFCLQRIIFRDVGRAFRPGGHKRRR